MTDQSRMASQSPTALTLLRDKTILFETWIFTERRIWLYGSGAITAYVIGLVVRLFSHSWLFSREGRPSCIDFSHFWVSGGVAVSPHPALVYSEAAFSAARADLAGVDACMWGINHFAYPPTFLFFTYPLGLMPYVAAFVAWSGATLIVYLLAIWLIVPRPIALMVALSPFPVFFNFFLGQNGFLLAGLMGLCLAVMERRPQLSGILLGLLTFKPQMGILFPLALVSSRKWRVLVTAMAMSVILVLASIVVFGFEGWPSFINTLLDREPSLGVKAAAGAISNAEVPMRLDSVYGFLFLAGMSAPVIWAVQLVITGAIAVVVCWIWARPLPNCLKAAALCSAAPLATPFVHGHDLCVLVIGAAFLVKHCFERGFLPGDRLIMLLCWIGVLLGFRDFSSGWIPCLTLLALVVRRVLKRIAFGGYPLTPVLRADG